jgi:hypothetical protein
LITVVTTWTAPLSRTPRMFTNVSSQIAASARMTASTRFVPASPQKTERYPTNATAIAALPAQTAIQYPHAVWKPMKSPNARRA